MREITSSLQLKSVASIIIMSAMEKLSDSVYEKWTKIIQEQWYDAYGPIQYERTNAILKSLIKTKVMTSGEHFWFEVYIDENLMNQFHPTKNEKSKNSSNSWGRDGEEILKIIENLGFSFKSKGTTVQRKPIHSYEQIVGWLVANIDNELKSELKKLGTVL